MDQDHIKEKYFPKEGGKCPYRNPDCPKDYPKTMQDIKPVSKEFRLGYDAAVNGSSETNCHFSIFSSPEKTKEWERGNKAGLAQMASI